MRNGIMKLWSTVHTFRSKAIYKSTGVHKYMITGVQEYRSSEVQEYRSTGVQEYRSTEV